MSATVIKSLHPSPLVAAPTLRQKQMDILRQLYQLREDLNLAALSARNIGEPCVDLQIRLALNHAIMALDTFETSHPELL